MSYELSYSDKILKQLDKLDVITEKRILNALEKIRIRPHHFIKKIVGTKFFRLRVGDYRIILNIENNKLIIYSFLEGSFHSSAMGGGKKG